MVLILELWWIEIAWKNLLNINIALHIINIHSKLLLLISTFLNILSYNITLKSRARIFPRLVYLYTPTSSIDPIFTILSKLRNPPRTDVQQRQCSLGKWRVAARVFLEKLGARLKADNYRCTRWSLRRGAEVGGVPHESEWKAVAFNLEHTRELAGTFNERDRCSLLLCSFIIRDKGGARMEGKSGEWEEEMEKTDGWIRVSENNLLKSFWHHPVGLGWSTIWICVTAFI